MYGQNAKATANFIDGFSPALEREKETKHVKEIGSVHTELYA